MTWLGFANIFLFQWFFIRLAKHIDDQGNIKYWSFIRWVVPCTGWKNNMKYIGKLKYLKLK